MCTLIISLDDRARWPVLVASTRDEFRSRPWDPPAEWWAEEHPGVIGGRDREAGGSWLAVDPSQRRLAVVLNRIEPTGLSDREAHSRGELPLLAAAGGSEAIAAHDLRLVRPFNLVIAEPLTVTWWRYDGADLSLHEVPPGLHIITAADLDDMSNPRQRYWLPQFEAAAAPAPGPEDRAPAGWGGWPELLADVDRPYDDPRALNVRHGGADGVFGTVSASLLAIGEAGVRYEFCPGPPDRAEWEQLLRP
jgi:transport and Golgi organization protein 2